MRERLYRSRTDRMVFGVAGGMADWLDLDPSLVRLVWALLILAGGVGLLLYVVAAIVVPEEPIGGAAPAAASERVQGPGDDWHSRREARRAARAQRSGNGAVIFGVVLILLGGWFLIDRYLSIDSALVIPALLIALGGVLVLGALGRSSRS